MFTDLVSDDRPGKGGVGKWGGGVEREGRGGVREKGGGRAGVRSPSASFGSSRPARGRSRATTRPFALRTPICFCVTHSVDPPSLLPSLSLFILPLSHILSRTNSRFLGNMLWKNILASQLAREPDCRGHSRTHTLEVGCLYRCRANSAHITQPGPGSGLDFQTKSLKYLIVPLFARKRRENLAHIRQSMPYSGHGFQEKDFNDTFKLFPLRSTAEGRTGNRVVSEGCL